jgi:hypothetical protein
MTSDSNAPGLDRPEISITVIDRREAIRRVSLMLGGATLVGGTSLLTACERAERPPASALEAVGDFSAGEIAFLDEVAETILPETNTPGARAAAVGAFMALMVTDTYSPEDQVVFRSGMTAIDDACRADHAVAFMDATPTQRLALLERLDAEQFEHEAARGETGLPTHYFRMMKQLTLLGYFTSEIGVTIAQNYVETPGRFDPCVPYTAGERSWAGHA